MIAPSESYRMVLARSRRDTVGHHRTLTEASGLAGAEYSSCDVPDQDAIRSCGLFVLKMADRELGSIPGARTAGLKNWTVC